MLSKLFEDMIGVPYEKDGRDPKKSLDCFGLVLEASKRMGLQAIDLNDPTFLCQMVKQNKKEFDSFVDIGFIPENPELTEGDEPLYEEIKKPEPGCMVLFYSRYPFTTHIGIMLDDCIHFIHVSRNKNVCIEKVDSILWRNKVRGFYKWTKKLL